MVCTFVCKYVWGVCMCGVCVPLCECMCGVYVGVCVVNGYICVCVMGMCVCIGMCGNCVCVYVCVFVWHRYADHRTTYGISSPLPSCQSWISNSSGQTRQQVPLPTELSFWFCSFLGRAVWRRGIM